MESSAWNSTDVVVLVGQTREGADRAKAELNGVLLHELELKIGWGKSVTIPPVALYTAASVAAGGKAVPVPKAAGAAVPPPGIEAAPPWKASHADDAVDSVGMTPASNFIILSEMCFTRASLFILQCWNVGDIGMR